MKKIIYFTILALFGFLTINAQEDQEIQWKSWPELEQALKEEPRPVFIFFHAEWCAYCKKIEREIFTKQVVIKKINSAYYAVEMDVEGKDSISFDGVLFTNKQSLKKRNGVHEIPLLLASREHYPFSLPATIILNEDFTVRERLFEYYTSKRLIESL